MRLYSLFKKFNTNDCWQNALNCRSPMKTRNFLLLIDLDGIGDYGDELELRAILIN